jgi:hypothetical protein
VTPIEQAHDIAREAMDPNLFVGNIVHALVYGPSADCPVDQHGILIAGAYHRTGVYVRCTLGNSPRNQDWRRQAGLWVPA